MTGVQTCALPIFATMNSTGTPALFMHAADAIHGDLGMILPDDMVVCISKSGNTPEIKVLVPLLKRTGAKLVAMVGNIDSFLAQQSDYVINATVAAEACPLNLAPTTSTTVALALGDALAMCLLECRNFSANDFAKYHPGGALGKKLYLKVEDLFPANAVPKVLENASIKEIILEMTSNRLGATAVVNDSNDLVGIITDGDLRRMLNKHENFTNIFAKDIMNPSPTAVQTDDYAVHALRIMQEKNITQLVVVNNAQLLGFVHLHDLLKEGLV